MLTREEVLAGWRAFLGREPDDASIAGHQECRDRAHLVSLLGTCNEFRVRQELGYQTLLAAVTQFEKQTTRSFDFAGYVAPTALSRSPAPIGTVLLAGGCMLEGWGPVIRAAQPDVSVDMALISHVSDLAVQTPRPIADYDCALVQVPMRMVVPDYEFFGQSYADPAGYQAAFDRSVARLEMALDRCLEQLSGIPVFVMNYWVPQHNGLGRLLPRYDLRNPTFFVESLNRALGAWIARHRGAHLLDIDQLSATFGRRLVQDDAFSITSHGGLFNDWNSYADGARLEPSAPISTRFPNDTDAFIGAAWAEANAMMRTLRGTDSVKMICVDIDDTLWRGVAAELDDPDPGIAEGWPIGFAESLAMVKRRGIILALVSKNDPARVAEIWDKVFFNRLRMDDFAIHKIGWGPKPDAVAEAIAQANVLPESVVFIDDNPVERAAVTAALPGIRTLGAPHLDWRMTMLWSAETQVSAISDESNRRTELIRAQGDREVARSGMDRAAFLTSLGLTIVLKPIRSVDAPAFARAFELVNKTNQFNTTGRRWTAGEAAAHFAGGGRWWTFAVTDRFTAYGLVGVALECDDAIVQFVMSCRVFGLGIEHAVLATLVSHAHARGAQLSARFVPTERNGPCRGAYLEAGWHDAGGGLWRSPETATAPSHVAVTIDG